MPWWPSDLTRRRLQPGLHRTEWALMRRSLPSGRKRNHRERILNKQHVNFSAFEWPDFNAKMTLTGRDLLPNLNSDLKLRTRPQFSGSKTWKFQWVNISNLKFKEADLTSSIWVHLNYLNNKNAKNENIRKSFFDIRQIPTPEWPYFDALGWIMTLEESFGNFLLLIII